MKVLVVCEESQVVCKAFRTKGHEAYSCDILPCSGGHPEWHLQQDATDVLKERWDMIIAHPPCTRLTRRAQYWNKIYGLQKEKEEAIDFFMMFINADCEKIAVENPIGIMNGLYRKPDQIIQPYQFGHTESKATCLWLKGLPKLVPTNVVEPIYHISKTGRKYTFNDKIWDKKLRSKIRSKTFTGIAEAMADQWG